MNNDEQNYKKTLLFKLGIIIIIAVIFFLWLASLRSVLKNNQDSNNETWRKINQDVNNSLNDLDKIVNNLSTSTSEDLFVERLLDGASSTATTTISTTTATTLVKEELSDLIKMATSTVKDSACPPYINCMPTIGEARPCVIPVGCENITQIAY